MMQKKLNIFIGVKTLSVGIIVLCILSSNTAIFSQFSEQHLVSDNPKLRKAALQQISELPVHEKMRLVPKLVGLLRGKDAYRVVPAFAKIGPQSVPVLFDLLGDPELGVRGFAAKAIVTIRPVVPENINKLKMLLDDPEEWVQQRAAESLLSIGVFSEKSQSIIWEMWKPAMSIYHDMSKIKNDGESMIPGLIENLKSQDPQIRAISVRDLSTLHIFRSDIEAASIQALQDPNKQVREYSKRILTYYASEAAMDALLDFEIAEMERDESAIRRNLLKQTQPHSRDEILATIPPDPDNKYPLEVADKFEMKSPDGTIFFTVLHKGQNRLDLLRIWEFRPDGYYLIRENTAIETTSLTAGGFQYKGKAYLHIMRLYDGTGYNHDDEFYRIENGKLVELKTPKGIPVTLLPGEQVRKGFIESFEDDLLEFRFYIWKDGDGNCCPTAGLVDGTYTISGNELKYETWNRSNEVPR